MSGLDIETWRASVQGEDDDESGDAGVPSWDGAEKTWPVFLARARRILLGSGTKARIEGLKNLRRRGLCFRGEGVEANAVRRARGGQGTAGVGRAQPHMRAIRRRAVT